MSSRIVAALAVLLSCAACTAIKNKSSNANRVQDAGSDAGQDLDEPEKPVRAGTGGVLEAGKGAAGEMTTAAAGGGGKGGDSAGAVAGMNAAGTVGSAAGSGGSGGTAAPPLKGAVRGKVIDLYRRPVVGLTLHIGDKTATTDASGAFTIDAVDPKYDVAFKLETKSDGTPTTFAWVFEGLTRRDPTLQVYRSADFQRGQLTMRTTGITFPLASDRNILAGFFSADGDFFDALTAAETTAEVPWIGPPTMSSGTVHAMLRRTSPTSGVFTLEVLAYDSKPVTLSNAAPAQVTLDLGRPPPLMGTISGRVNAPGDGARTNWVRARWADGAFLPLIEETPAPDTFSYPVPMIDGTSFTFVAIRGTLGERPYSIGIADTLSAGQKDIELNLPTWPSLTAPADKKSNVDETTPFQWRSDTKVSMLVATATEGSDAMYVVTAAQETRLAMPPRVPYVPRAGSTFEWYVITHGDYASMDDATGPEGFISAYSYGQVHGPRRGPGSYTTSVGRTFTTPP